MIVDNTKKVLEQFNIMPKKGYGQNFLINKNILEGIVNATNISKEDCVIEIGPGLGSLTEFLCLKADKVLCYEIDDVMINVLQETLKDYNNVKIIHGDFLKQNVKNDIENYFGANKKVKVVANLPYYITTPIIFKLFEIDNIVEETFMVQKEMGERFIGTVNTKDYNALSVFMKYYTDTKKVMIVGRNNFNPVPNVDSIVLNSKFNKKNFDIKNEEKFLNFVKQAFAQRRKTMVNNIASFYKLSKPDLEQMLVDNNFDKSVRSESLSLEELAKVYKILFEGNN